MLLAGLLARWIWLAPPPFSAFAIPWGFQANSIPKGNLVQTNGIAKLEGLSDDFSDDFASRSPVIRVLFGSKIATCLYRRTRPRCWAYCVGVDRKMLCVRTLTPTLTPTPIRAPNPCIPLLHNSPFFSILILVVFFKCISFHFLLLFENNRFFV